MKSCIKLTSLANSNMAFVGIGVLTAMAGLTLQYLIARALDDNKYVLMASLDLSAAFDIVNVPLLVKRLRVIGLPNDVVELIEMWLRERFSYILKSKSNFDFFKVLCLLF